MPSLCPLRLAILRLPRVVISGYNHLKSGNCSSGYSQLPFTNHMQIMEQTSIKSFFAPTTAAVANNTAHKRTASFPSARIETSARKGQKMTVPSHDIDNIIETPATDTTMKNDLPQATTKPTASLDLTYHKGDIFSAPSETLLIHACNTQGSWGSGIAAAFRARYPAAYKIYRDYCTKIHHPTTNPVPTGTCLLIPPSETTTGKPVYWIACLFTSAKYGKAKDAPKVILDNTGQAMQHLLLEIKRVERDGHGPDKLRMCMINSGKFGVPWNRTVEVLEGVKVDGEYRHGIQVWSVD